MISAHDAAPIASITCWRHGVAPTIWPALRSWRLSPATAAAQHTTAPIMIAAIGPSAASRPMSRISTSDANRIVAMVIPETGLLEEPMMPAMYADTDENRNPATIMMTVIGTLTVKSPTIVWYSPKIGNASSTMPTSTGFIGRSCSVWASTRDAPARVAARPLLIPDRIDPRSEISVHTPPISIAPTPR